MRPIGQAAIVVALLALAGGDGLASAKDQDRISAFDGPSMMAQNATPLPLPLEESDPAQIEDGETAAPPEEADEEELNLGEIPDLKSVELTADTARRALDTYLMVREKYRDAELEAYDELQDFVDKNERGKDFEADIKAAGFATVDDWNLAITSLGFAYSAATDDPTDDIKLQIDEINGDESIAQDLKDRMISSLNAMIPSENNRKVVAELMADPGYKDKLAELDTGEGNSEGE